MMRCVWLSLLPDTQLLYFFLSLVAYTFANTYIHSSLSHTSTCTHDSTQTLFRLPLLHICTHQPNIFHAHTLTLLHVTVCMQKNALTLRICCHREPASCQAFDIPDLIIPFSSSLLFSPLLLYIYSILPPPSPCILMCQWGR